MSEELKPCPYCGDAMPTVNRVGRCYTVECGCGMTGPYGDEPVEAIAIWNALPRRSDIERVEQERDWLAREVSSWEHDQFDGTGKHIREVPELREAARKAVEEGHHE